MKKQVLEKGKVVEEKSAVTYAKVVDKTLTAAPKKEELKKETVNKATIKKDVKKTMATEKKDTKTTVKATAPKAPKMGKKEIFIQYGSREIGAAEIQKKIEAAYVAEGHKLKAEDDVKVYVKPEENMMYYVINESYASGINLFD